MKQNALSFMDTLLGCILDDVYDFALPRLSPAMRILCHYQSTFITHRYGNLITKHTGDFLCVMTNVLWGNERGFSMVKEVGKTLEHVTANSCRPRTRGTLNLVSTH